MDKRTTFTQSELDRIAEAIKMSGAVRTQARPSAGRALAEALARAGVDISAIGGASKQRADATRDAAAQRQAYQRANAAELEALRGLAGANLLEIMDAPFLIWEFPRPDDVFIDSGIQPLDSFVRVLINDIFSHDTRTFVFYFLWRNPSPAPASVVFATSLVFNGECSVTGAPGIFSGTKVDLNVSASLFITRWSGWGKDPNTGDGTVVDTTGATGGGNAVTLHAEGGHIFQGPGSASQSVSFLPINCGYRNLIVPGDAVALLGVQCAIFYAYDDGGGDIEDLVSVDFSNAGRFIGCPRMIVLSTPA